MIQPGKTQIKISDVSLIQWYNGKALRFSVALAVGDRGGDLYMVEQGCIAVRNRFKEIEWSLPIHKTKNSAVRRYSGWVSPRMYEEVRRFLEQKFGHRIEWVKRPNRKSERLDLDEGEETIEFATSGGPGPIQGEGEEIYSPVESGGEGGETLPSGTGELEDPYGS